MRGPTVKKMEGKITTPAKNGIPEPDALHEEVERQLTREGGCEGDCIEACEHANKRTKRGSRPVQSLGTYPTWREGRRPGANQACAYAPR